MAMEHFEVGINSPWGNHAVCLPNETTICLTKIQFNILQERIVPNLKSKLNSQCILPSSQMTSAMASATKLTMRPVPLSNSYRLIYSTIPKSVDASSSCSGRNLTSLEEEFSNLNRSLSQLLESQKKEMHQLKNKVSCCS